VLLPQDAVGRESIFTNVDPTIHAARGFEVPVTPGVRLHHIMTVNLSAGTIDHVVNDTGAPVDNSNTGGPASSSSSRNPPPATLGPFFSQAPARRH
jgi:hypothetical protein